LTTLDDAPGSDAQERPMDDTGDKRNGRSKTIGERRDFCTALAVLLLGTAAALACRADSQLQTGPAGRGTLSASAHLDFRVTVLPSVTLSMQPQGARVTGNAGVLTVQHSRAELVDGAMPSSSVQLRPQFLVIDAALPRAAQSGSDLVTIASP
jgi:hypothetical protein